MLGLSGQVFTPCLLLVLSGALFTPGVAEAGQGSQGLQGGGKLKTGEVVWTACLASEQAWAHSCPHFSSQPEPVSQAQEGRTILGLGARNANKSLTRPQDLVQ